MQWLCLQVRLLEALSPSGGELDKRIFYTVISTGSGFWDLIPEWCYNCTQRGEGPLYPTGRFQHRLGSWNQGNHAYFYPLRTGSNHHEIMGILGLSVMAVAMCVLNCRICEAADDLERRVPRSWQSGLTCLCILPRGVVMNSGLRIRTPCINVDAVLCHDIELQEENPPKALPGVDSTAKDSTANAPNLSITTPKACTEVRSDIRSSQL